MESPHYKLVFIHTDYTTSHDHIGTLILLNSYYINIYSSESGIWKKTHFSKPGDYFSNKVLCDGAIYWNAGRNNLLRFDINAENLTTVQIPSGFAIFDDNAVSWLGKYAGNLLLFVDASGKLQIVEVDMHHYRLSIKFNIDRKLIIDTTIITHFRDVHGISFSRNVFLLMGGDKETLTLLFFGYGRIISYNPKSNYNEIIQDLPCDTRGIIKLSPSLLLVHKFIASLAVI